jgi:DNA-binding winged helix-turn-helix (wHTH) protein
MNIYALGPFRLDTHSGVLLRGTEPVALGRRAVALLRAMVERPGALVSKDALIEAAWPGQAVEDSNLTVQIATLRRVLSETPGGDSWIETMPRRGYRFIGPVVANEENGTLTPTPRDDTSRGAAPIEHGATPAPQQADPPPDAAAIEHGEAERRQLTALSCELVGMSAGAGGMDLEDLREAVGDFQRCVSETAGRHEGFVARCLGNSVLVLFGYPETHEHDAEQAVRAGLDLCAAVGTLTPPRVCRCGAGSASRQGWSSSVIALGSARFGITRLSATSRTWRHGY